MLDMDNLGVSSHPNAAHSCDKSVVPYLSDKMSYGKDFEEQKVASTLSIPNTILVSLVNGPKMVSRKGRKWQLLFFCKEKTA